MNSVTRRQFLLTASASAATSLVLPHVYVASAQTPETTSVKLGFVALTDACPLIIAKEKGYFDKYGMKGVEIIKQSSWGTTRDNLVLSGSSGGIDGAHILSPMPYLMTTGKITNNKPIEMNILARLNINGQGICISNEYKSLKVGLKSNVLKEVFAKAKASGKDLRVAVTFPGGTHDLWMRYWLAAGGIDPEKEVSITVVPPPQMVANMKIGNMEAFCVGEPWPLQLVNQDIGYGAITTGEFWKNHPEKSLAMRADWVDKNPKAAVALTKAIQEAQIWCDSIANAKEMCEIIAKDRWLKAPVKDILDRSKGDFKFGSGRKLTNSPLRQRYWGEYASYPFKSHDVWFLIENIRWGNLPAGTNIKKLVDTVNREDIWKEAAKGIGQSKSIPKSSSRGVETFFDGVKFDPQNPSAYLKSLKIKKV